MKKTYVILISAMLLYIQAIAQPIIDKANMDLSVKPGDDFFIYANGTWIKNTPIPPDLSRYGSFDELRENNTKQLQTIVEEAASDPKLVKGTNRQKIGDFYASGMDEEKINLLGISPIQPFLDEVALLNSKEDVIKFAAKMTTYRSFPFFYITAGQDEKNSSSVIIQLFQAGIGLPDRDYYLKEDERSKAIRSEYRKHIEKMLAFTGNDEKTAGNKAELIFNIETKIAEASYTRLELRDPDKNYNKISLEELSSLSPGFDWKKYFSEINLKNPGEINASQKNFFEKFGKIFEETSLNEWKVFLEWFLIRTSANSLSNDIVNTNFEFFGKFLSGAKELRPRWKRVVDVISGSMGEALGEVYVSKYFPPESKQRMLELVENIKLALKDRINKLDWMSEKTKSEALAKLEKINVKVGYPDKWKDYSNLNISRDSYFQNILNSRRFSFEKDMKELGKPVDRAKWGMSPQTVNAYYSPNMNEIVFPAGILQPPFFFANGDDAVNYGGIGVVIGHEITHGFDDQGRKYDKDGNLKDWWTEEDAKNFEKKTQVLVDQYNNFYVLDTLHVDGKLTLGENIADLGGVTIALEALKKAWKKNPPEKITEGFTPMQRFFLSYAQIWRGNIRDKELMKRLKEDEHSPSVARVNGIVYNVPEFYDAFNVVEADKKFIKPSDRAVIW